MTVIERPTIDFLTRPKRLFIGGEWVDGVDSSLTSDPATGEVLAEVPVASTDQVDQAVQAATNAFQDGWRDMAPTERQRLIWKLGDLLEEHKDEFAVLEVLDNGKPLWEAELVDIALSIEILRYYAGWATKIQGDILPNSIPGLLSLRKREFINLAKLSGMSDIKIVFREILPNMLPYVGTTFANAVSGAILAEVFLEILGLGPQNTTTLGVMVYWAMWRGALIRGILWWVLPPMIVLVLIFIGLQLINIGLDEVYNPRVRKGGTPS